MKAILCTLFLLIALWMGCIALQVALWRAEWLPVELFYAFLSGWSAWLCWTAKPNRETE